jgi:hypothetical protein
MKFRLIALLVALPALLAGLLVASPAEASSKPYAFVSTKSVAISPTGGGKVFMRCAAAKTCKGKISFQGGTISKAFSVAAKTSKYVSVAMHTADSTFPTLAHGAVDKGDYNALAGVHLIVNEDSPSNVTHAYTVTTESAVTSQTIRGTYTNHGTAPTDVHVELVSVIKGGNTVVKWSAPISDGGSFAHNVSLGANNSSAAPLYLRVTGYDQDGEFRSWFWRGTDGNFSGGGKYIVEASRIIATKSDDFNADFQTGSISGSVNTPSASADVTVAAPPASYSSSAVTNREMDISGCANVFGETQTTSGGNYTVNFLPFVANGKRYMVEADDHTSRQALWNGAFGSCFDVLNYTPGSTANLIPLNSSGAAFANSTLAINNNSLTVNGNYSFKPTAIGDRYIRLRERIPNTSILDAPVVAEAAADADGIHKFTNLPKGKYWVEVGRRTGCSAWYPSRYTNNAAYLSGADRGAESWKTVNGKYPEHSKSYTMGYVAKTPPKGYHGWMYRGYCGTIGTGVYSTVTVGATGVTPTKVVTVHKGAVITGHVSRGGGRTNKEMMVSVYSTGHTLVLRTDLTDGGGNFSVKGLQTGTYHIEVNADSWRGITRAFTGKHTIHVTAGHTYHAGTLHFQSDSKNKVDLG